MTYFYICKYF